MSERERIARLERILARLRARVAALKEGEKLSPAEASALAEAERMLREARGEKPMPPDEPPTARFSRDQLEAAEKSAMAGAPDASDGPIAPPEESRARLVDEHANDWGDLNEDLGMSPALKRVSPVPPKTTGSAPPIPELAGSFLDPNYNGVPEVPLPAGEGDEEPISLQPVPLPSREMPLDAMEVELAHEPPPGLYTPDLAVPPARASVTRKVGVDAVDAFEPDRVEGDVRGDAVFKIEGELSASVTTFGELLDETLLL